ncbi:MAG: hypothetical protein HY741_27035 [Chloroflexi bacterium]|nr:hypothetical protein [Chloroflexota bacterium]
MAFVVQDYYDLTRLLTEHPEWRADLRLLLLSDELLTLPEIVRELAAAQQRTEARLEQLAADVRKLTEDVRALTEDVRQLTVAVHDLTASQKRMEERLGRVIGDLLELRYREHVAGYFGSLLRHAHTIPVVDLEEHLERALTPDEVLDVLRLDLVVNGRWRERPERPEVWLAVEVAALLNEADVARAWRLATLLRRAGFRTIPVVAGEQITRDGEASARAQNVAVLQDGQAVFAAEALAAWLA